MSMRDRPEMFWFIVGAVVQANILTLIFGLTGIRLFTRIVGLARVMLLPLPTAPSFLSCCNILERT